jgi:hypothetical protein
MEHRSRVARLSLVGLAALALLGPIPVQAQDQPKDQIPFKWTVSGKFDAFVIPFDPPVASSRMTLKGTSEVLGGAITMTDTHIANFGSDGNLNRSTNGMAVFAGPSGDALFVIWDGVGRVNPTTGELMGLAGFTVKGGRGRFAGATGSGTFDSTLNVATGEVTQVWQGTILVPKK